jgi:dTDP-glucose 4,6-dehydratase
MNSSGSSDSVQHKDTTARCSSFLAPLLSSAAAQAETRTLLQQLCGRHVLVTGGCGFIGSCFIRCLLQWGPSDVQVYNLDSMEYCAGTHVSLTSLANKGSSADGGPSRYHFIEGSILDAELVLSTLRTHHIDIIVHMAAQTHVDNSFSDSLRFTQTNVVGTHTLLECARAYGQLKRFLHIGTDEVYGETEEGTGAAAEATTVLRPTNPYAATKAAAEHLAFAYFYSFHVPVLISRGNNVYGPGQYPEKVIPKFISECLRGNKLPIQGDGHHKRSFMYVEDVARGLLFLLVHGEPGEAYNVASTEEWSVCDVARRVVACVKDSAAEAQRADFDDVYVRYVPDRAYNDARYFISNERLASLGWVQQVSFEEGLQRTVEWYREHPLDGGYWKGRSA